jgi:L-seryl-tRNA(Ser) seleniumtransferase
VEAIRKNPINRAVRIDKMTLVALEETLRIYRDRESAVKEIPTLRMISTPYEEMVKKAERLLAMTGNLKEENFAVRLIDGSSRPGGGALPLAELPTRLICLVPGRLSAQFMERWLRRYDPPIIARLEKEKVLIDVRTIQEREFEILAAALRNLSSFSQEQ